MRKVILLGAITVVIIAIVVIVPSVMLMQPKEPLLLKDLQSTMDLFEEIQFTIDPDKETYSSGEDVTITASLSNTGSNDTTIYCSGCENSTTGEKHATIIFYVYDEYNNKVWEESSSSKYDDIPPIYVLNGNPFNITIETSSTYEEHHVWNQTYGASSVQYGTLVPPGTYKLVAELRVTWAHYYGSPWPVNYFGNQKIITIEP